MSIWSQLPQWLRDGLLVFVVVTATYSVIQLAFMANSIRHMEFAPVLVAEYVDPEFTLTVRSWGLAANVGLQVDVEGPDMEGRKRLADIFAGDLDTRLIDSGALRFEWYEALGLVALSECRPDSDSPHTYLALLSYNHDASVVKEDVEFVAEPASIVRSAEEIERHQRHKAIMDLLDSRLARLPGVSRDRCE